MDAYLVAALRTPRGKGSPKGALRDVPPVELTRQVMAGLVAGVDLDVAAVDDVLWGCVTQTGEQGANLGKTAAMLAGFPGALSGATINRFCASGLSAVNLAAASVASGSADVVLAGGTESTSRVPMFGDRGPWFADRDVATRTKFVHMGVAADLSAAIAGVAREDADSYAAESQRRAAAAREADRFVVQPVVDADGNVVLDADELIRPQTTAEALAKLPALFGEEHGIGFARERAIERGVETTPVHTVGNSPQLADGAAALLVANKRGLERLGLKPRARIAAVAHSSAHPVEMVNGNGPAVLRMLERLGWPVASVDRFEVNEGFAGPMVALGRELGADRERLNPDGGAIAMGHALGATGGILVGTALDGLEQRSQRRAVVSICGGAGVVATLAMERLS